ncbi:hypothetical protein [Streptomyces olivochromogenes]|uniref:hypothetical protein n=1 Tax=Streptomyces olivochromogenes TaxID=1963 RepID=UPI001F3BDB16|nr:hypothetical protein [Streptomyces olivochromogenes]MCF3135908.1 hypothetical protein [Streptomyces olivochromogenes]
MEALTVLAAPSSVQTAWLEKHGVVPDEIALDFDDGFRMAEHLMEQGLLSRDALPDLRMIDSIFDEMTRDPSPGRWETAALISDTGWGQRHGMGPGPRGGSAGSRARRSRRGGAAGHSRGALAGPGGPGGFRRCGPWW